MRSPVNRELLPGHSVRGLVRNRNSSHSHGPVVVLISEKKAVVLLDYRFQVLVDVIDATGRVHPAHALIESLVDEELTPGYRARSEEHTSELQSHSFISYAVFCL